MEDTAAVTLIPDETVHLGKTRRGIRWDQAAIHAPMARSLGPLDRVAFHGIICDQEAETEFPLTPSTLCPWGHPPRQAVLHVVAIRTLEDNGATRSGEDRVIGVYTRGSKCG